MDRLRVRDIDDLALQHIQLVLGFWHAGLADRGVHELGRQPKRRKVRNSSLIRQARRHDLLKQGVIVFVVLPGQRLNSVAGFHTRLDLGLKLLGHALQPVFHLDLGFVVPVDRTSPVLNLDRSTISTNTDISDRLVDLRRLVVERGRQFHVAGELVETVLSLIDSRHQRVIHEIGALIEAVLDALTSFLGSVGHPIQLVRQATDTRIEARNDQADHRRQGVEAANHVSERPKNADRHVRAGTRELSEPTHTVSDEPEHSLRALERTIADVDEELDHTGAVV